MPLPPHRALTRRRLAALFASGAVASTIPGARASEDAGQGSSFYYRGPRSDHFDGSRFFNPDGNAEPRSLLDGLRWQLTREREPWPDAYPSQFAGARPDRNIVRPIRATFVGHATFLLQTGGLNILTDPVWSDRASPFQAVGPGRVNAPGIAFDDLPQIDIVLLSHNHYDHMDLPTLERLWRRDRSKIVAPLGNDSILRAHDPSMAVTVLDWGEAVTLDGRMGTRATVTAEPVQHWSARALTDRNHALWAGFMIAVGRKRIFFAGDTGFGDGRPFRRVAARHGAVDLALLPIGAYEPRWFMRDQHMNPDDAVQASRLLGARQSRLPLGNVSLDGRGCRPTRTRPLGRPPTLRNPSAPLHRYAPWSSMATRKPAIRIMTRTSVPGRSM